MQRDTSPEGQIGTQKVYSGQASAGGITSRLMVFTIYAIAVFFFFKLSAFQWCVVGWKSWLA